MGWVRVDDHFPEHPKLAAAGPLALAMQVAALCYCNRKGTDGFVPRAIARTLLDWQVEKPDGRVFTISVTSGMAGEDVGAEWVIDSLLDEGIWDPVEGGYLIHDYAQYQPTRAEVEGRRVGRRSSGGRKRAMTAERDDSGRFVAGDQQAPDAGPSITPSIQPASGTGAPSSNGDGGEPAYPAKPATQSQTQPQEQHLRGAGSASPHALTNDQGDLLSKLHKADPRWAKVKHSLVVKMNRQHGVGIATRALTHFRENPAPPEVESPAAVFVAECRKVAEQGESG